MSKLQRAEVRREMEIHVVLFAARLRSEQAWEVPQPLLRPEASRGKDTLLVCCWCDHFEVDGEWVGVEEATQ